MRALSYALFVILLGATIPACSSGPKPHKVTGKLNNNGKPYVVDDKVGVTIVFVPILEQGKDFNNFPATWMRETSSFEVPGPDGKGIPPGKYKVTIMQMSLTPTAEINAMNERFDATNTKIVHDITNEFPIIIDLAKPDGK